MRWDRVLELMKGSGKIIWHGDVTCELVIILVKRESAITGTIPVDQNGVQFFEGLDYMVGVFFANIFDAKIVNDQRESDVFGSVFPKRGHTCNRGLAKLRKVELEAVIGDASGLIQNGYDLADLHANPPI